MRGKGLLSLEHVIDGPTEFLRNDRESLGFALFIRQLMLKTFRIVLIAKENDRRLAESPLQMSVADLIVAAVGALAGGFMGAFDQPCVGDKVHDFGEPGDVVDLVEEDECEDRTDARDRL